MTLIEFVFLKLRTPKMWSAKCLNVLFDKTFDKQDGKRTQALLKSASQHLYQIDWSLPRTFSWKTSLLLTCQILEMLVNIFPTDEKYPVLNRENLTMRIEMQLSQKKTLFLDFFVHFWNLE